jgi:hypothetical protein
MLLAVLITGARGLDGMGGWGVLRASEWIEGKGRDTLRDIFIYLFIVYLLGYDIYIYTLGALGLGLEILYLCFPDFLFYMFSFFLKEVVFLSLKTNKQKPLF